MTAMDSVLVLLSEKPVVNPLPFSEFVFFGITFVIMMALLAMVLLIGKTRPHS